MRHARSLLLVLGWTCIACQENTETDNYVPAFEEQAVAVEVCDLAREPLHDAERFVVVDDMAIIELSYGGGCEAHYFKLCWDGHVAEGGGESVVDLRFLHEDNRDLCEAFITRTIVFDLTPIRALAGPDTPVQLRLAPAPDLYQGGLREQPAAIYPPGSGPESWCEPLGDSCDPGFGCVGPGLPFAWGFGCTSQPGELLAGSPCFVTSCAPGLYCEPEPLVTGCATGNWCCNAHCELDAPGEACSDSSQVCVPWPDPPAGLETLGLCSAE